MSDIQIIISYTIKKVLIYFTNSFSYLTFAVGFEVFKYVGNFFKGNYKNVFVAQLVEQLTLNQWVQGSSPCKDTFFLYFCATLAQLVEQRIRNA